MLRGTVAPGLASSWSHLRGLANSGWWLKPKNRGAAPVHGDCRRRQPNPVSRRPEAGGGGDEENPHMAASQIWGSERSGSHRERYSITVEARARGRGARHLVGELRGAVPELREVRLGLGTACSSGAPSSSGGTPSGHTLGLQTAPARQWLRAWRGDGGGRLHEEMRLGGKLGCKWQCSRAVQACCTASH
jgi:hypothetical protein